MCPPSESATSMVFTQLIHGVKFRSSSALFSLHTAVTTASCMHVGMSSTREVGLIPYSISEVHEKQLAREKPKLLNVMTLHFRPNSQFSQL